jgi:hypothetical protein
MLTNNELGEGDMRRQGAAITAMAFFMAATLAEVAFGEPAPEAVAELRAAIDALKVNHLNRDRANWQKLEADAFVEAKDAKTPADTYPAIRTVIKALGERHTFLQTADAYAAMRSNQKVGDAAPPVFQPPEAWLLDGHMALLRVPGFMGDEAGSRIYVGALRRALSSFAERGICRFAVDLRGNWGGDMHPMQSGLAALLSTPPFGYFSVITSPSAYPFGGDNAPSQWDQTKPPPAPYAEAVAKIAHPHVAVLIDGNTASSGEFTAVAFKGLPYVRFFGTPTAGFVTNNTTIALPDGAHLFISNGWSQDRLHRPYQEALDPDEVAAAGQPTVDAAVGWLKSQPCR